MNGPRQIPTSLKVVAWLFIIGGWFAVVEILLSLMRSHISVNLGVLGIPIGHGLLRLSRGWRTWALVFIWIGLILLPVFGLFVLSIPVPFTVRIFGRPVGYVSTGFGLLLVVMIFAFEVWQYRVLTRPDVVEMFITDGADW
jgi:hypothetical protein